MTCAAPPELDESQLIAAVEGEPTAAVREHLALCPHCRARAEDLARLYAGLRARLYRLDCPPAEDLGELQLGVLAAERRATLQTHLSHCPHCRRELQQLDGYLDSLAAELELSVAERVRVLVARLVRGGGGPILGIAPAGVRGAGDGALIYEAGATQLALEILPAPGRPGHSELFGLVSGWEGAGLIVTLLCDGQPVATAEVDPIGNFVLGDLAPGTYELNLRGPGLEVQLPDLRVP
jgi:anti-sigma factor RsiW